MNVKATQQECKLRAETANNASCHMFDCSVQRSVNNLSLFNVGSKFSPSVCISFFFLTAQFLAHPSTPSYLELLCCPSSPCVAAALGAAPVARGCSAMSSLCHLACPPPVHAGVLQINMQQRHTTIVQLECN